MERQAKWHVPTDTGDALCKDGVYRRHHYHHHDDGSCKRGANPYSGHTNSCWKRAAYSCRIAICALCSYNGCNILWLYRNNYINTVEEQRGFQCDSQQCVSILFICQHCVLSNAGSAGTTERCILCQPTDLHS